MHNTTTPASDLLGQDEAADLLKPYVEAIRDCILKAWHQWEEFGQVLPEARRALCARTRANFLYDHICQAIIHRFDGVDGVSINTRRGFLMLNIRDRALVRFKKLDKNLHASNIATYQQVRFTLQMELPGIPKGVTRLVAGYQLDRSQTAISDMVVTQPYGNRLNWFYSIGTTGEIVRIQEALPGPVPAPRVRAKRPMKDASEAGS